MGDKWKDSREAACGNAALSFWDSLARDKIRAAITTWGSIWTHPKWWLNNSRHMHSLPPPTNILYCCNRHSESSVAGQSSWISLAALWGCNGSFLFSLLHVRHSKHPKRQDTCFNCTYKTDRTSLVLFFLNQCSEVLREQTRLYRIQKVW